MKIPEKAPDWRKIYNIMPAEKRIVFPQEKDKRDLVIETNKEYLYWDKFKHKAMPEGLKPEEAWAIVKRSRQASFQVIPLFDRKQELFIYFMSVSIHKFLHLIDRGMEKVITEVLTGQTAKEYQLNSIMEEAIASSQIEGAATTRAVAKEMLGAGRPPKNKDEKMIVNNFKTISLLKEYLGEQLTPEIVMSIHASMTEGLLDELKAGKFRDDENAYEKDKIKVFAPDRSVLHTPPLSSELEERMELMCRFANEEDEYIFIHPVIKAIILHFWLAYEHPFEDGNGRTARALFYWYLLKHDYPLFEFLSISSVINKKRTQYYKAFLYSEIDDNDLTYFIMFHLKAIEEALDEVVAYIKRKKEEKKGVIDFLKMYPSLNDRQLSLLADALEKPEATYTFEKHARVHGVVRQSARTDLLGLKDLGLLDMRKEGRKFVFTPVSGLREKLRS